MIYTLTELDSLAHPNSVCVCGKDGCLLVWLDVLRFDVTTRMHGETAVFSGHNLVICSFDDHWQRWLFVDWLTDWHCPGPIEKVAYVDVDDRFKSIWTKSKSTKLQVHFNYSPVDYLVRAAKLVVRCEREWWIGIAFMLAIALPSFLGTFTRSLWFAVLPKTNGRPHNKHTGAIRIGQRRPYKWSQSHFLLAKGRAVVN